MGFPSGSPSAAALAAESGGVTGGSWAKAIELLASARIGNPKINFITVFIMLFHLCERAVRSRVTLREEGQVELQGESPN
jgi:hypothetical protein